MVDVLQCQQMQYHNHHLQENINTANKSLQHQQHSTCPNSRGPAPCDITVQETEIETAHKVNSA